MSARTLRSSSWSVLWKASARSRSCSTNSSRFSGARDGRSGFFDGQSSRIDFFSARELQEDFFEAEFVFPKANFNSFA